MIDRKQDIIITVPEQHTVEALEEEFLMIPDWYWLGFILPLILGYLMHRRMKK